MPFLKRLFAGADEAIRTPSGVNVDLLTTYCPRDGEGRPDFAGNECRLPSHRH